MRRTSAGSCFSRNDGLFSRSGETSSTSTSSAVEPAQHVVPLVRVRRVDRHRPHPGPLGGGDLVAHEREQRGHEHGRAGAARAQQQRRDEVHRRLAPPGALHDERAAAAVDERLDRLELPVVELGVGRGPRVRGARRGPSVRVVVGARRRGGVMPPLWSMRPTGDRLVGVELRRREGLTASGGARRFPPDRRRDVLGDRGEQARVVVDAELVRHGDAAAVSAAAHGGVARELLGDRVGLADVALAEAREAAVEEADLVLGVAADARRRSSARSSSVTIGMMLRLTPRRAASRSQPASRPRVAVELRSARPAARRTARRCPR